MKAFSDIHDTVVNSSGVHVNRPTERGGVAGASAPGPGGPKGARRAPSKNLSLCEKRWKRGRNGEVKNCSSDTINIPLVWSLTFLRGPPGPLRIPGPRLQLPSGIQDLPHAAGWLSKVADRTKIRRQQRNKIILKGFSSELYPCTVLCFWILAKFVSTPHWK